MAKRITDAEWQGLNILLTGGTSNHDRLKPEQADEAQIIRSIGTGGNAAGTNSGDAVTSTTGTGCASEAG